MITLKRVYVSEDAQGRNASSSNGFGRAESRKSRSK